MSIPFSSFPCSKFYPQKQDSFPLLVSQYEQNKLREKIYYQVITELSDQKKGCVEIDLKKTNASDNQYNYDTYSPENVKLVAEELRILGWKTIMAYANTSLFICKSEAFFPKISNDVISWNPQNKIS